MPVLLRSSIKVAALLLRFWHGLLDQPVHWSDSIVGCGYATLLATVAVPCDRFEHHPKGLVGERKGWKLCVNVWTNKGRRLDVGGREHRTLRKVPPPAGLVVY